MYQSPSNLPTPVRRNKISLSSIEIHTDCPGATRMGYNVEYDITLYVDDQDLKETLYYRHGDDRGDCGWFGPGDEADIAC